MADWPGGVGRLLLDETDSTNAEAARRAAAGEAGPLWILARRQTAARGRRGRPWAMPEGNFAASLLFTPPGGPREAALRSFTASLALRAALVALVGHAPAFALKWPNDVLLDGGKLAGILLETAPGGRLVVGIGVNLAAAPDPGAVEPGALRPVSLAGTLGRTVAPEALLPPLARAFAEWEARLCAEGFGPVRAAWLAAAARLGQSVTARMGGRVLSGRFETVDADGALVLHTGSGRERVTAADIQFT